MMNEMGRIHEGDALPFGGLSHPHHGCMADERFFDKDMFAGCDRRECDVFLGSRRGRNVDGVDVCVGEERINALNGEDPWTVRDEVLCGVQPAA